MIPVKNKTYNSKDGNPFNNDIYNSYINSHSYSQAADYLERFTFNDVAREQQRTNAISRLRREGPKIEAMYNRITNPNERSIVDFAETVGTPGWYQNLKQRVDSNGARKYNTASDFAYNNPEAMQVVNTLRNICGSEATRLSYQLGTRKRKADISAYEFFSNIGMSEEELRNAGVEITRDSTTGFTSVSFDKSSGLAMKVIEALPKRYTVNGYKQNDDGTFERITNLDDNIYTYSVEHQGTKDIQRTIKHAKRERDKIFKKRFEDQEISTTKFPLQIDDTQLLKEALTNGAISVSEYNARMNNTIDLKNTIRGLPFIKGSYITDGDKKTGNTNMHKAEQKEWNRFKEELGKLDNKDLIIEGMMIDGQLGVLYTIPIKTYGTKDRQTKEYQLFVPQCNDFNVAGKLQQQLDNDSNLQAIQMFNNIKNYGAKYKLSDGSTATINDKGEVTRSGSGGTVIDTSPDAVNKLTHDLEKTILIDSLKNVKYQYELANGDFDYANYIDDIKIKAIKASIGLYGNTDFTDINGNALLTTKDNKTFDYSKLFEEDLDPSDYHTKVYDQIMEIREIYNNILSDAINNK